MTTTWQIWLSKEGTEGLTSPKGSREPPGFVSDAGTPLDLDGVPMDLLHEFEIEGAPDPLNNDFSHVKKAFAYANHWRHETPEGIAALTGKGGPA